jgi:signal transduction histidine kinase
VDAHGGSVGLDSTPGQGARFAVRLPAPRSVSG